MPAVTIKDLLESGVHFGHQTRRWNPKMKKYIFEARNGIYIIDLQKTVVCINDAYRFVNKVIAKGGEILFVGTKRQAKEVIADAAQKTGMYHVSERWLGGMLTNLKTIRTSVKRLLELEQLDESGTLAKLPKKEAASIRRETAKLHRNLDGIKTMDKVPDVVFIVDPKKEHIAVAEAKKLGIPIVGLIDTNCDPDTVDFVIPGNDDAIRSIRVVANRIIEAVMDGKGQYVKEEPEEDTDFDQSPPELGPVKAKKSNAKETKTKKAVKTDTKTKKPVTVPKAKKTEDKPKSAKEAKISEDKPKPVKEVKRSEDKKEIKKTEKKSEDKS